jgi:hypothetical protein
LAIHLSGDLDFTGTVSITLAGENGGPESIDLPMSASGSTVQWKGIPRNRLLMVSPNIGSESFSCWTGYQDEDRDAQECDGDWIRTQLDEIWSDK